MQVETASFSSDRVAHGGPPKSERRATLPLLATLNSIFAYKDPSLFESAPSIVMKNATLPSPSDSLFEQHASLLSPGTMEEIRCQFALDWSGVHGVAHWARVLENGLTLCCGIPEARVDVVVLFALFHDSRRQNEHTDPGHGERAARLAEAYFQKGRLPLDTPGLALLTEACRGHDRGQVSGDPTIGVCWDADRLDLARVGILPSPRFLSTERAKEQHLLERCVNASRSGAFPRRGHWIPTSSLHST